MTRSDKSVCSTQEYYLFQPLDHNLNTYDFVKRKNANISIFTSLRKGKEPQEINWLNLKTEDKEGRG